jgi:RHS repeat-associated protein
VGPHAEWNSSTGWTNYYFSNRQRVAMRSSAGLFWLHSDHLGSTSLATNSAGGTHSQLRYTPWGQQRWANGNLPTDYRFTDQRLEGGVELYDYDARLYSPALLHFISPDSIVPDEESVQDWNRYGYVQHNPLKFVDPTGHTYQQYWMYGYSYRVYSSGTSGGGSYRASGTSSAAAPSSAARAPAGSQPSAAQTAAGQQAIAQQQSANRQLVQEVANRADAAGNRAGHVSGPVAGTWKHEYASKMINKYQGMYGDKGLRTNVSVKDGKKANYGESGSARLDVAEINEGAIPISAYDFKFGGATLKAKQITHIQTQTRQRDLPVYEVKPL